MRPQDPGMVPAQQLQAHGVNLSHSLYHWASREIKESVQAKQLSLSREGNSRVSREKSQYKKVSHLGLSNDKTCQRHGSCFRSPDHSRRNKQHDRHKGVLGVDAEGFLQTPVG